jgi:hypothetical protein
MKKGTSPVTKKSCCTGKGPQAKHPVGKAGSAKGKAKDGGEVEAYGKG